MEGASLEGIGLIREEGGVGSVEGGIVRGEGDGGGVRW